MSVPTFAGAPIFGLQTREVCQGQEMRMQRETLPGVNGFRVYRLGKGPRTWQISGRLHQASRDGLNAMINAGLAKINGIPAIFVDSGGQAYANCLLMTFAAAGEVQKYRGGVTVRIVATVVWMTPV